MTYFDATHNKNYVYFDTDVLNRCPKVVAYRVPEDAEYALLLLGIEDPSTITIKAADSVLGGKDQIFPCECGYNGVFLELSTFIQRSGEHKGCVLIECAEDSFESDLFICSK